MSLNDRLQWRRNEFESGGTGPEQKWGHRSGAKRRKKFFWSCPPLFGSKSTICRFGERFRDGQYSFVSFLFAVLLLTVPSCPAICKSGGGAGHVPPCPMESAPLTVSLELSRDFRIFDDVTGNAKNLAAF